MVFSREDPSRVDYFFRSKGFLDVAYRGCEAFYTRLPGEEVERGYPDYTNFEAISG